MIWPNYSPKRHAFQVLVHKVHVLTLQSSSLSSHNTIPCICQIWWHLSSQGYRKWPNGCLRSVWQAASLRWCSEVNLNQEHFAGKQNHLIRLCRPRLSQTCGKWIAAWFSSRHATRYCRAYRDSGQSRFFSSFDFYSSKSKGEWATTWTCFREGPTGSAFAFPLILSLDKSRCDELVRPLHHRLLHHELVLDSQSFSISWDTGALQEDLASYEPWFWIHWRESRTQQVVAWLSKSQTWWY